MKFLINCGLAPKETNKFLDAVNPGRIYGPFKDSDESRQFIENFSEGYLLIEFEGEAIVTKGRDGK